MVVSEGKGVVACPRVDGKWGWTRAPGSRTCFEKSHPSRRGLARGPQDHANLVFPSSSVIVHSRHGSPVEWGNVS